MDKKIFDELIKKYGSRKNIIEMYKNNELSYEEICRLLNDFSCLIDVASNPYGENYSRLLQHIFMLYREHDIFLYSSKKVDEVLHGLDSEIEQIIRMKFGLDDGIEKTRDELRKHFDSMSIRDAEYVLKRLERIGWASRKLQPKTFEQLKENKYISDEKKEMLSKLESEVLDSDLIFKYSAEEQIDFDNTKLSVISDIMREIDEKQEFEKKKEALDEQELPEDIKPWLSKMGIDTLDKLTSLTQEELKSIKGMGTARGEFLINMLFEKGILLRHKKEFKTSGNVTLISDINLSGRSLNALKRRGITHLEELANFTYKELKGLGGLGNKSFEEVINMLHEHGIVLKDSGENERKILRSKKIELEMRLKQLEEETRQCKEMLDTYNKLIDGDKTNTEDEAPDFKDE